MHPYATDSNERRYISFFLAVLAIATAWGFALLLQATNLTIPWWLGAPSAMGFFVVFYGLFDRKLWRLQILCRIGIVKIPVLDGPWQGHITTSFDEHATKNSVEVQIVQGWTRLRINLRGKDSRSHSLVATLVTKSPDGVVLNYQYLNEPLPHAKRTMQIHYGTARLTLSDSGVLTGEYYSGRGRQNQGFIYLERVAK